MPSGSSGSEAAPTRLQYGSLLLTLVIVAAFFLSVLYQQEFVTLGNGILERFSSGSIYVVLFLLAAASSTLVPLPVWIYVLTCVALGFNFVVSAIVIALGSAVGSASSYVLGRYYRESHLLARRVDQSTLMKWQVRSRPYMATTLFFGTVSPIPMDVVYAVAGVLRFPLTAFAALVTTARIIRYVGMAYLFFFVR